MNNQNRKYRLQSALNWLTDYDGNNLVKSYSKKYAVDKLCAVKELRLLGVEISKEYESTLFNSLQNLRTQRKKLKEEKLDSKEGLPLIENDEQFDFIIGYTTGGAPFGILREEMDCFNKTEQKCQ